MRFGKIGSSDAGGETIEASSDYGRVRCCRVDGSRPISALELLSANVRTSFLKSRSNVCISEPVHRPPAECRFCRSAVDDKRSYAHRRIRVVHMTAVAHVWLDFTNETTEPTL
jgi:hypothetical protein